MLLSARTTRLVALCALRASAVFATSVPSLSFEELTDHSEAVVSGHVNRSWSEWDTAHRFIWTHHVIAVSGTHKGSALQSVTVSELGGIVGGLGQSVAGSVSFAAGEDVVLFLQRMPNGLLRTTGWGQGKYRVDAGRIHADQSLRGLEVISTKAPLGTPLHTLDGMTVNELKLRIAARVRAQKQEGVK